MIGAAIFASKTYDPHGLNPGYRHINGKGGEPFNGTGELPTNCRWLTNISSESAFNSQIKNTPRLLDEKYLRVGTSSILLELGLKFKPIEDQAIAISRIFDNTMTLAKYFFGIDEPPHGCLASGITSQIGHNQVKSNDSQIAISAQKSILQFAQCERQIKNNTEVEFVSLIIPRVSHAEYVLKAGAPYDSFYQLSKSQLPASDKGILDWVLRSELPMICRIEIGTIDREYNHLINWGNGAGYLKKQTVNRSTIKTGNQREFATSNEIKELAKFCDIRIQEVSISNTPVECKHVLPDSSPTSELSYSYGIIAENLWCSLLRDRSGKYLHSPMTAWIHASDRMACLSYAKKLSEKGFVINGYGYGRITVAIEAARKQDLKIQALEMGLLPYLEVDVLEDDLDITEVNSNMELLRLIYSSGHLPFIMHMDDTYLSEVTKKYDCR